MPNFQIVLEPSLPFSSSDVQPISLHQTGIISESAMSASLILRESDSKSAGRIMHARTVREADRVRVSGLPEQNSGIKFLSKRNLK